MRDICHKLRVLTLDQIRERGTVEVTIEGLGFQGEGFVRLEDGWLSVRGALPGERVVATLQAPQLRSRRLWASLERVVTPVDRRGAPFCDAFPACRGCQLRHVTVFDELGIKAQSIAECIARYGGVPEDEQPAIETIAVTGATRSDAYRVRTNLTIRWRDGHWDVGLRADDTIVNMVECPALTDSVQRAVSRFEEALAGFRPDADCSLRGARIAAPVHGHGYVELLAEHDHALDPLTGALDRLFPPGFGIAVSSGGKRRHVRGPERIRLPMADLRLEVGFDDWFHATLEPAEVLYDSIQEWLNVQDGETLLDAGCGVGTIGLTCARRGANVVGFDVNKGSVETAELNAIANGLEVEFRTGAWERVFRKLTMEGRSFETVVINPMRDPLGDRPLAYLPRLKARKILYLGPSAAPAAKDLSELFALGYRLERLGAVNLHPATYHVMLAALLELPPH